MSVDKVWRMSIHDIMEENQQLRKILVQEVIYYERLAQLGLDHGFDSDMYDITGREMDDNETEVAAEYIKRVYGIEV